MIKCPTSEKERKECSYLVVVNIFQGVADHADAHVDQVRGGHLKHLLGELLSILVDLL